MKVFVAGATGAIGRSLIPALVAARHAVVGSNCQSFFDLGDSATPGRKTKMKKQAKFGIGIGIIVVALGFLAWLGYGESKTYYHTIAELGVRCERIQAALRVF